MVTIYEEEKKQQQLKQCNRKATQADIQMFLISKLQNIKLYFEKFAKS